MGVLYARRSQREAVTVRTERNKVVKIASFWGSRCVSYINLLRTYNYISFGSSARIGCQRSNAANWQQTFITTAWRDIRSSNDVPLRNGIFRILYFVIRPIAFSMRTRWWFTNWFQVRWGSERSAERPLKEWGWDSRQCNPCRPWDTHSVATSAEYHSVWTKYNHVLRQTNTTDTQSNRPVRTWHMTSYFKLNFPCFIL